MKLQLHFKPDYLFLFVIVTFIISGISSLSVGQEAGSDKPSAPFFIIPDNETNESLPLLSTAADIQVSGVIALTTVKQVYCNRGLKAIEAVYVFPGSTGAAVHALKMKIGERTIMAKIEEREKARHDYTQALNEGHSAALLEQHRPNVFQMNVANIMPGDLVEVELMYTEVLVPREGIYTFTFPAVVSPRYVSEIENGKQNHGWNENPYLHEGELPPCTFKLACHIVSGIPIKQVKSSSHKINADFKDKKSVNIQLDRSEMYGGNRDFILQYRLGGEGIESGLWLYSDEKENYFMASIQPPDKIAPGMVLPREYIFIVDVSGSMYGFPLNVSKRLINELLSGLKASDCFNILFFAGSNNLFADKPVPATAENVKKAIRMLDSQSGSGGTELLPALKRALSMEANPEYARTFVVATDGFVSVEKEAFGLIQSNLNKASFFAFGIGSSVNRYLIEGLAHAGAGKAFIITNETEANAKAAEFVKYINSPLLTGIDVSFNGFDVYDVEPVAVPDLFLSRPVVIFGKYRGNATGNITLRGHHGSGLFQKTISVETEKPSAGNQALKYLWARERIRMADDYAGESDGVPDEIKAQITKLGLEYNLLTAYTSFVAVDSEQRNINGAFSTVRQPLPLPQGVSHYAVGSSATGGSALKLSRRNSDAACMPLVEETEALSDDEDVFMVNESMPEFPGGPKAMEQFMKTHIKIPVEALKYLISGKVVVQFTVNTDGTISDIQVLRSLGYGCDEEAIRLIKSMPAWKPGKQHGVAVRTKMQLPVSF